MAFPTEPKSKLPLEIKIEVEGDRLLSYYKYSYNGALFINAEKYDRVGMQGNPSFFHASEIHHSVINDKHPALRQYNPHKRFHEVVGEIYNDLTNPNIKIDKIDISVDGKQYGRDNYELSELKDIAREVMKRATTKTEIGENGEKIITQRQFEGVNLDEIGSRTTPDTKNIKITENAKQAIQEIQKDYTPSVGK